MREIQCSMIEMIEVYTVCCQRVSPKYSSWCVLQLRCVAVGTMYLQFY